MRAIAIDDEPLALSIIESFCQRYGGITLSCFSSPLQGVEQVKSDSPELVFLDIEMYDISGLELASELPPETLLIFTTAHANYALEGFELNAIDFLHKPFSYERFTKAINKVEVINSLRENNQQQQNSQQSITIKVEYKNITLPIAVIRYIESMDNYIKIHTLDGQTTLTQMSMKGILEILPQREFIRIHRSFVVSRFQIKSFTRRTVEVQGTPTITLTVGRLYANSLIEQMG